MSMPYPLLITRCPSCNKKLALNGTMLPGTQVVCVSCGSHLALEAITPLRLQTIDPAASRNEDARPEAYG